MNTGDAGRPDTITNKQLNSELYAYKEARRQGIQPEGTTKKQIEAALKASETLGTAYNAETMGASNKITKKAVKKVKEQK